MHLKEAVEKCINSSVQVIRMYDWLLDLYVLDFFVDNQWERLPESWRETLQDLDPQILGKVLLGQPTSHVLPLSLLAMLASVQAYSLPRKCANHNPPTINSDTDTCASHPKLKNLFLKHVKYKKRHEISSMADIVAQTASNSNCKSVIDFGSGLGHLVRMLVYRNNLYAAGIECQTQLTEEARKLDEELEYTAAKHLTKETMCNLHRPTHLNVTLSSVDQLNSLPISQNMSEYGLTGLHPCGDLGPLLLKHFVNSEKVKFICVVGCCYMKLSCDNQDRGYPMSSYGSNLDSKLSCDSQDRGYPMSSYVSNLDSKLSYQSREIACHAMETYCERLVAGKYEDLKIHAFRASLERILVEHEPGLKHAGIRSIKHSDTMTFEKFMDLALERLDVPIPTSQAVISRAYNDLGQWRRIVILYSLRLALAPLVETVVLLDRVCFVLENGFSCKIKPVFDPKLSPRNHIIVAQRL